jgi:hypothetical protein
MYASTDTETITKGLLAHGFAHPETQAAQVNFASTWNQQRDGTWEEGEACDYNCVAEDLDGNPTGNDYTCGGANIKNPGMKIASMAPPQEIIQRVEMIFAAQAATWKMWAGSPKFSQLMERFEVTDSVADGFKAPILKGKGKKALNCFGGNTELYRRLAEMFGWCQDQDINHNFTTVGKKIAKDKTGDFVHMLQQAPPKVFAFSFDHIKNLKDLEHVLGMSEEQLMAEHEKEDQLQGPRRKLLAGVTATRRLLREPGFEKSRILWNVVFKHSNVRHLIAMAKAVHAVFPTVIFNPYPSQSSPYNTKPIFSEDDLPYVNEIIQWAMDEHDHPETLFMPPRYHFWQLLESARRLWCKDPSRLCAAYSGYDLWRCYENVGAGFYTQMGITGETYGAIQIAGTGTATVSPWEAGVWPGLKLACYWNRYTVSDLVRIKSVDQVMEYLNGGMKTLAMNTHEALRCRGCLMGRLMGGALTTWAGIPDELPELAAMNVAVRKERVGW